MLNHVNCKPSPSVYSCKSFITDGPGHKFKDKSFFVVKNIDQYFVRSVLFFVLIINMQDKIRIQEPDTAQHQLSTRWWWWILDGGDGWQYWPGLNVLLVLTPGSMCPVGRPGHKLHTGGRWPAGVTSAMTRISPVPSLTVFVCLGFYSAANRIRVKNELSRMMTWLDGNQELTEQDLLQAFVEQRAKIKLIDKRSDHREGVSHCHKPSHFM